MTADQRNLLRAPWLAVTLLAALAALCMRLGFWQLDRAEQSRALSGSYAQAETLPSLEVAPEVEAGSDLHDLGALRYRHLRVDGRYLPDRQFLIDGIVRNGIPGYYVLTPFQRQDGPRLLLVNRGWVRANPDRSVLPNLAVDDAPQAVAGRLDRLPTPGLRLGGGNVAAPADAAVQLLSYPTLAELEHRLGRALLGYQLLLDPDRPQGFDRDWTTPAALEPSRHIAYAGQWWLFAAVAGVAACAIAWRTMRRSKG